MKSIFFVELILFLFTTRYLTCSFRSLLKQRDPRRPFCFRENVEGQKPGMGLSIPFGHLSVGIQFLSKQKNDYGWSL